MVSVALAQRDDVPVYEGAAAAGGEVQLVGVAGAGVGCLGGVGVRGGDEAGGGFGVRVRV